MNQLDSYYRALLAYRAVTEQNRDCNNFRNQLAKAGTENEKIVITRAICTIDEEWINEIELGLEFIEKAIKEERQFIYSNGEVLPVEKVKHVSTETVKHLAKHSNLIGKTDNTDDFIPDKLYTVERLNDYAVYENRFLYMLLSYLRDFVSLRYSKILELCNKYDGVLKIDKEALLPKQKVTLSICLHDERSDDPFLREQNGLKEILDRIDVILKAIISFLSTPLMEVAAKTPMLKPPITKTNILKMDNNFKGAVALYDYIISYTKPGYEIKEHKTEISPFQGETANEISDVLAMLSFLTYEHGLGIETTLKNNYDKEERERKDEAIRRREEKLLSAKKKLALSELSAEEYIAELENQIKALESRNSEVDSIRKELYRLRDKNEELIYKSFLSETKAEKISHDFEDSKNSFEKEIDDMKADFNVRIRENLMKANVELKSVRDDYDAKISSVKDEARQIQDDFQNEVDNMKKLVEECEKTRAQLLEQNRKLSEEKLCCEAKLKALKIQQNLMKDEDDFTEKESFAELEAEYEAFKKFYKSQWSKAKKKIRSRILTSENIKGKK